MTVASVRSAMATALRTISGLHVSEYLVDEILPPHAMFDFAVEPHTVFAYGADMFRFRVKVFASRSSDTPGQKFLDTLRDPSATSTNLAYVLENDATLAAAVQSVECKSVSEVQIAVTNAQEFLMVEWEAEVVI